MNNDLIVSPIDALIVINRLNLSDQRILPATRSSLEPYLDTNGDGLVSAVDALRVINLLNVRDSAFDGYVSRVDGEAAIAPAGFLSIPILQLPGNEGQSVPLQPH